jgi:outer membrane protein assembly factor BamB
MSIFRRCFEAAFVILFALPIVAAAQKDEPEQPSFAMVGNPSAVAKPLLETSAEPTKPLWQTKLNVQETDFIEFVSKDRVLVGTIDTSDWGGGPKPHEIMLLNSVTGETVWAVPRGSYGSPQTLMAFDPVILIDGSKQIVALNPENGTQIWSQERAHETSLLLSDKNLLVLLNRKAAPMAMSAVSVKTGSEAWKSPIENYPEDEKTRIDVISLGDAVLLSGPEVAAFSASDGKLLWRMPFPGTFGPKAGAIPLGDDLYFSDGSTITRSDPASGKEMWRAPVSDGAFQALTANERGVFILLKGSGEKPPDSIAALERNTGKQLWKSELLDRAASPMNILGDRLYVTTPGSVIAMKTSDGSLVFKTEMPSNLQSRRQLPDNLRIASDRIIVAREDGVLAVQKSDGKLLFADQVVGGKGFTYDFSTSQFLHASMSAAPRWKNHTVQLDSDSASPEDNYRVATAQQRAVFQSSQATINSSMMNSMNMIKGATTQPPGQNWSYQQQQFAAKAQLGGAIAVAGIGAAAAVLGAVFIERRGGSFRERVEQTFQTHASSLQEKFYIRPSYEQHQGWSLRVVNLETGEHANILLSSDADESPNIFAANLPAFSTDGSRIVSKGLGFDPERLKKHKGFLIRPNFGANPSVLAFDLASLRFTQDSNSQIPAVNPVDPERKKLNDQLLAAAFQNDVEAARKALDAGANVNAVDAHGNTALMLAAEAMAGSAGVKDPLVRLLLERGADADIRDPSGLTALEHNELWTPLISRAQKDIKKAQKELN